MNRAEAEEEERDEPEGGGDGLRRRGGRLLRPPAGAGRKVDAWEGTGGEAREAMDGRGVHSALFFFSPPQPPVAIGD